MHLPRAFCPYHLYLNMFTNYHHYNRDLFDFLSQSPTAFHATETMRLRFLAAGFTELNEKLRWNLRRGDKYFVVREGAALAAFTLGADRSPADGFRMTAAHSDSPCLQLKPHAAYITSPYLQLGVEVYGSPLLQQWFDRPLSLAGRVCCKDEAYGYHDYLLDFARPLLTIPTVAIHLDREANEKKSIDKQKMLPPILAQEIENQLPDLYDILQRQLHKQYPSLTIGDVLSFDLFCYDAQPPCLLGLDNEFISGARLDNLLSCHAATTAACAAESEHNTLFIATNHEENGSTSTTGAQSSFVEDIFNRLIPDGEERQICMRNSMLVSMDNAHAVHPNYPEKADPAHKIILNGGVVIKINANQRYATSSRTSARFKLLAEGAGVPVQEFVMRSDMPCGSTVGPMTAAKLGVETIDIGAPTFGMHSIREITGSRDPYMLFQVASHFLDA